MSENLQSPPDDSGTHQDPAEPYKTDTEVETTPQPDGSEEDSSDEEPADQPEAPEYSEPPAQPLTPEPTPSEPTSTRVGGRDYEVSADRGHREVPKQ